MAFSDFIGLSVNDTALEIKVSNVMLRSLIQDSLYRDGVGITEVFSSGAGIGGAVLQVPKITNATGQFRTLGAAHDGAFFSANAAAISSLTEVLLVCKHIYTDMEDVPEAQHVLSLAGGSAVGIRAERIAKQIAKQMNAGTMAYQLKAVINAVITAAAETNRIFTYTEGTEGSALGAFLDASSALDDGDGDYNDYFPVIGRIALLRPSCINELRKKGNVIVNGSNFAQDIMRTGAVDAETVLPEIVTGYRGMINDTAVFMATQALWTQAESWLGVPAGYLDKINGIICAATATGRGHAFPDQTKVIDSPSGVGLRIQPLSNFGVEVFFEGGIKLLADGTFVEGSVALAVEAPGSVLAVAPTGVTITGAATVAKDATITLTATVAAALDGSKYAVMWSSADATKLTVGTTYTYTTVSTCVITPVANDAGTLVTAQIMAISYVNGVKTYTALATPLTDTHDVATTGF